MAEVRDRLDRRRLGDRRLKRALAALYGGGAEQDKKARRYFEDEVRAAVSVMDRDLAAKQLTKFIGKHDMLETDRPYLATIAELLGWVGQGHDAIIQLQRLTDVFPKGWREKPDGRRPIGILAIRSLGEMGDREAAPILERIAQKRFVTRHPDAYMAATGQKVDHHRAEREEAIIALGKIEALTWSDLTYRKKPPSGFDYRPTLDVFAKYLRLVPADGSPIAMSVLSSSGPRNIDYFDKEVVERSLHIGYHRHHSDTVLHRCPQLMSGGKQQTCELERNGS